METCEVNFNEMQPCSSVVFNEKERDGEDDGESPTADVPSTSTTMTIVQDDPPPTPTTTHEV
jgi:hypothetical protein